MSDYEIVRGIGAPLGNGNTKYPFPELDVGDGFYSATDPDRVRSAASVWGRKNGRKFATRKQADGRVLVVRVE